MLRRSHKNISDEKAQAMIETVMVLPLLVLLFAGVFMMGQVALAHIVVQWAAYDAGRQTHINHYNMSVGEQRAGALCRLLGSGPTNFSMDGANFRVTYQLTPVFPVLGVIAVTHTCPDFLFQAGETR